MDNETRKTKNHERATSPEDFFAPLPAFFSEKNVCRACGGSARRGNARFCATCGKVMSEDYQPLDALRASYKLQGKTLETKPAPQPEIKNLFERNDNAASATAWAFVVYSLVPYIGILFCPGAFLMGGVGILVAQRRPYLGGGRTAAYSIALSLVIFGIQIFLWWLLYIVPELGRQI